MDRRTVAYELDLVQGNLKWSEALYKVYGFNASEPVDTVEWWTNHIHPDDAMRVNQNLDKLIDTTITQWTVTYRFRRGDNTYLPVRDHAVVFRDTKGTAVRLTGTIVPADEA